MVVETGWREQNWPMTAREESLHCAGLSFRMTIGSATPVSTPILADRITTIRAGPVGLSVNLEILRRCGPVRREENGDDSRSGDTARPNDRENDCGDRSEE